MRQQCCPVYCAMLRCFVLPANRLRVYSLATVAPKIKGADSCLRPCLYNTKSSDYFNRDRRRKALDEIAAALGITSRPIKSKALSIYYYCVYYNNIYSCIYASASYCSAAIIILIHAASYCSAAALMHDTTCVDNRGIMSILVRIQNILL